MKKTLLAILIASSATSAFAVSAQTGFSIGAAGGWSYAQSPNVNAPKKNKNYTWSGSAGFNYAANPMLLAGFEAGYVNFGKIEYGAPANATIKNNGVQVLGKLTYLLNTGFNIFAKGGVIDQESKVNNNSYKKWLPAVAAGLGYMPVQSLNIALQYEHTFGSSWNRIVPSSGQSPMTQNAITLGITYNHII